EGCAFDGTVVANAGDGPACSINDELRGVGGFVDENVGVVSAGGDDVTDADVVAVAGADTGVCGDFSLTDSERLGTGVEFGDGVHVTGEHDGVFLVESVGLPCRVGFGDGIVGVGCYGAFLVDVPLEDVAFGFVSVAENE